MLEVEQEAELDLVIEKEVVLDAEVKVLPETELMVEVVLYAERKTQKTDRGRGVLSAEM